MAWAKASGLHVAQAGALNVVAGTPGGLGEA
jgi:hypothetical protein